MKCYCFLSLIDVQWWCRLAIQMVSIAANISAGEGGSGNGTQPVHKWFFACLFWMGGGG
jgi:hypothetical protein